MNGKTHPVMNCFGEYNRHSVNCIHDCVYSDDCHRVTQQAAEKAKIPEKAKEKECFGAFEYCSACFDCQSNKVCKAARIDSLSGVEYGVDCKEEKLNLPNSRTFKIVVSGQNFESEVDVESLADFLAQPLTAADVLQEMADTFRERNAGYGDNYKMVAPMVAILFPNGVPPELVIKDQWHLFELMLVKISRFAISNLTHQDSIHDTAIYGAMIEAILKQGEDNER